MGLVKTHLKIALALLIVGISKQKSSLIWPHFQISWTLTSRLHLSHQEFRKIQSKGLKTLYQGRLYTHTYIWKKLQNVSDPSVYLLSIIYLKVTVIKVELHLLDLHYWLLLPYKMSLGWGLASYLITGQEEYHWKTVPQFSPSPPQSDTEG